jgi:DNA-binding transcriptional ArsR family regulator
MPSDDTCELLCLDLPKGEELRHALPALEELEAAAAATKALSEPTRLAIAHALRAGGELCVCDLGWVTRKSEKLISHHVRLMRSAGVLRSRKDGRMVLYALTERGRAMLDVVLADAVRTS